MKRLLLLRHAKSGYPAGVADHDRPLDERGERDAPRMGTYLAAEGLLPDLALVSSAARTQATFAHLAPSLGALERRTEAGLYEAPPERILDLVRAADDPVRTLLVVAHNPGLEDLARRLVGFGDRYAFARLQQKFSTAGLAVIDFDVESWRDVAAGQGRLDRFVTPKSLAAAEGA